MKRDRKSRNHTNKTRRGELAHVSLEADKAAIQVRTHAIELEVDGFTKEAQVHRRIATALSVMGSTHRETLEREGWPKGRVPRHVRKSAKLIVRREIGRLVHTFRT